MGMGLIVRVSRNTGVAIPLNSKWAPCRGPARNAKNGINDFANI